MVSFLLRVPTPITQADYWFTLRTELTYNGVQLKNIQRIFPEGILFKENRRFRENDFLIGHYSDSLVVCCYFLNF